MFVIDASITLAWCFDDESSDLAEGVLERVLSEGAIAPAHWPLEVANAIRSAERRGRIKAASIATLRSMLTALPIDVVPVELATALGVLDTARRHDLSVSDAAYLDLADVRGLELATADSHLASACRTAGVQLIA